MQDYFPWHIMFRAMVLNTLAVLLGIFFTGTLALVGMGVNLITSEPRGNPVVYWIGAGITFLITLFI